MPDVTVSAAGLRDLSAVFDRAERDAAKEARKVLVRGALNIKNDARKRASGIGHAPNYPRTIGYDMHWSGDAGWAEIGPRKDYVVGGGPHRTPGNLGNILEYGNSRTPARPHLGPALDAEVLNFERHLFQLGEDLLS